MTRSSPDPAWPVLSEYVGFLLQRTAALTMSEMRDRLREVNTDVRHFGLLRVLEARGPQTQQELGRELLYERSAMTTLLDGMEAAGLVTRERHPFDRRANAVHMTEAGRVLLANAKPIVEECERASYAHMRDADHELLRRFLVELFEEGELRSNQA